MTCCPTCSSPNPFTCCRDEGETPDARPHPWGTIQTSPCCPDDFHRFEADKSTKNPREEDWRVRASRRGQRTALKAVSLPPEMQPDFEGVHFLLRSKVLDEIEAIYEARLADPSFDDTEARADRLDTLINFYHAEQVGAWADANSLAELHMMLK